MMAQPSWCCGQSTLQQSSARRCKLAQQEQLPTVPARASGFMTAPACHTTPGSKRPQPQDHAVADPTSPTPPRGGSSECPGTPCPRCRPRDGPSTRARWRRPCAIGVGFRHRVTSGDGRVRVPPLFIPAPTMTPSPQPASNPAPPVPHVVCWKHAAAIPALCGRSCAETRDCSPLKACTRAMATADEANLTPAARLYSMKGVLAHKFRLALLLRAGARDPGRGGGGDMETPY